MKLVLARYVNVIHNKEILDFFVDGVDTGYQSTDIGNNTIYFPNMLTKCLKIYVKMRHFWILVYFAYKMKKSSLINNNIV